MLFFIKNILWNQKKAVILHAELRTYVRVAIKTRFFINFFRRIKL